MLNVSFEPLHRLMLSQTKGAGSVLPAAEVRFFFLPNNQEKIRNEAGQERQRDVKVTAPPSAPSNRLPMKRFKNNSDV